MRRGWAIAAAAVLLIGAGIAYFEPFPPLGYGDRRDDEVFRDCPECPEMVPMPTGQFTMGDQRRADYWLGKLGISRGPSRTVVVDRPFAVGRFEVTFAQWDACVADGGCDGYTPSDEGWGRGDRPVIHVNWNHAQAYVRWLREKTGQPYRLLTEAEWEYVARAGTPTLYAWGKRPDRTYANFGECMPCKGVVGGADRWLNTAPVGQFPANRWGLFDVHGNVYEWVEDCYQPQLPDAVVDSAPIRVEGCDTHVIRGGTWYSAPLHMMVFYRSYTPAAMDTYAIGLRVARDLS